MACCKGCHRELHAIKDKGEARYYRICKAIKQQTEGLVVVEGDDG